MQDGFSTLGTRATLVALTQRGRELLVKKYLVAAMKSTPIIDQHFLKNYNYPVLGLCCQGLRIVQP